MANRASRRTDAAAKRGGGFLSHLGNSRVGRRVIAPVVTAAGLASQVNAEQTLDRLNAPTKSSATPRPSAQVQKEKMRFRGAKPNPLPPGMDVGSRLAAEQQRDRLAGLSQETGELADINAAEEPTFLESNTRSYARPDATDTETEMTRQRQMRRTAQQFLVNGPGEPTQEEEAPEESPLEEREPEEIGSAPQQIEAPEDIMEEEIAADFAAQQAQERYARQEQARGAQEGLQQQAQALIQANKRVRMVSKAVQAAGAESIVTIVTLWLQMNLETLNKWVFRFRIPGIIEPEEKNLSANDVGTGCFNVTCCFACLPMFLYFVVLIFALVWWADTDPVGATLEFIKSAVGGVFG